MIAWLKARLRDHFGFSTAEAKGTLVLLLLITVCLAAPPLLRWWYQRQHLATGHDVDIALLEHTLAQLEGPQPPAKAPPSQRTQRSRQPLPFDMNKADQAQLRQIKGIGPKLSARIVKFRDKLGGFVSPAQYKEVYDLSPAVHKRLQQQTYIATEFQPARLNINTASVAALAAHPYLSYQQARRIVQHRTQQGPWASLEDLRKLLELAPAAWDRLQPYLTVS